jgi:integrase
MASIYKRGKTSWIHCYVNGKSVGRSLRTRNERVARDRKKKLEAVDIEEQLQVLAETPALHVMVATFIFAGPRREEAMWLTPADVDLDRRLLRVRAKTFRGEAWQPKTGPNRVVPIGDALLSMLRNYEAPANRSWFFLSPGGTRWHPDNFSAALRQVNDAHGLTWSCLDYRHTFGSHLAQRVMHPDRRHPRPERDLKTKHQHRDKWRTYPQHAVSPIVGRSPGIISGPARIGPRTSTFTT